MKQVINNEDKAVSPIIATILLIAITVVLAATLVTILGGFTHGASNTVEAAGVTTTLSTNGTIVTASVSTSSQALTNSQVTYTLTVNGTIVYTGLLSQTSDTSSSTVGGTLYISTASSSFTGGSVYTFFVHSKGATSSGTSFANTISNYELTLNYKGTQFYSSGTQTA
ncbi:MAG: type IV pilin [Candidatus Thermoplasmatota archaeon]|jgi:flagellin-like protein|nr:type IV pilin [Candidatus Thermoplasmatota archaeon]MCL5791325.1 type IV pilin [Candidatus Thermoplasmatota archaeon]